jgi:hypothetical protein
VELTGAELALAGFSLRFRVVKGANAERDQAGIISVLRRRYAAFLGRGGAGLALRVSPAEPRQNPFKPSVRAVRGGLELGRGDFRACVDLCRGRGTLEAAPNEQCLDAFLRSLLSSLLLSGGGLMLHSAGLVKKGKAYIFPGKSGAGKSTLARLAAAAGGCEVISDEINLLRYEKGRFRAYGSPFWGEMRSAGRKGSWPLGGILLPVKGRAAELLPCGAPQALRTILRCTVNFDKGPAAGAHAMRNAARLLAAADIRRMEFRRDDAGFMELIGK